MKIYRTAFIWMVVQVFQTHSYCIAHLDDVGCVHIQDAGRKLSDDIQKLDSMVKEVVVRCFQESASLMETSVQLLMKNLPAAKIQLKKITSIEDANRIQQIEQLMDKQIETSLRGGHTQIFSLIKRAAKLVVNDEIVANELIKSKTTRKRRDDILPNMNSLDGKIASLRKGMLASLQMVENDLKGAAKQLFQMFTDSLKMLYTDQQHKKKIEDTKVNLENYLRSNLNTVIQSELERFYIILKEATQQIEIIDSLVKDMKSDPNQLADAINPAKVLVAETIKVIQDPKHADALKNDLSTKIQWMKTIFLKIKASMTV